MIYLDYSATTPVNNEVLDTFIKATNFIGNPNSLHKLGLDSKKLIDASTKQIANILNVKESEVIYTSGASESNNTAIKGICLKYQNRGKHIITTRLEHSSVTAPISYLQNMGFEVSFVKLDNDGKVDLDDLKSLLRKDTILVSIASVNSEIGIRQDINLIGKIIKENSNAFFHSDITQSIGKEKIDLTNVDISSFSAQKFYGFKGVGCLIKKDNIALVPLIHGGKSTTVYRSGTPATNLIASTSKALRLVYEDFDNKYNHVLELNKYLRDNLNKMEDIHINSPENAIPHILNISVMHIKPETLLHALEEKGVYISTQSACSSSNTTSKAVLELTKCEEQARHSVRISLSHKTTDEEIENFLKTFGEVYKKFLDMNE